MEVEKIQERVLEIQNQIKESSPEQQTEMLSELISLASNLEQLLFNFKDQIKDGNT